MHIQPYFILRVLLNGKAMEAPSSNVQCIYRNAPQVKERAEKQMEQELREEKRRKKLGL